MFGPPWCASYAAAPLLSLLSYRCFGQLSTSNLKVFSSAIVAKSGQNRGYVRAYPQLFLGLYDYRGFRFSLRHACGKRPVMQNVIGDAKKRIRGQKLKLVMPEGCDPRIIEAAGILQGEDLALPIVFSEAVPEPSAMAVHRLVQQRKNLTENRAAQLLRKPLYAAGGMVADGTAHAMLAGVANPTARVIEAALMTIGLAQGISTPSSFFLMQWPSRVLLFADCAVNIQPNATELAAIAVASARSAKALLNEATRVAFLSFSTKGSSTHADQAKVVAALQIARQLAPDFLIDGEMQGDAALCASVASRKISGAGDVAGRANVLVFPDLDAGNIAYKLCQYLGGAKAVGPVLQGFAKPVSDLSRGASVTDIVDTAALLLSMVH